MTIPVQIETGNHKTLAHLHAVPRVGEKMTCAFPSSGLPRFFLVVTGVYHHQPIEFDGRECPEPFRIVVTTDGDPDMAHLNDAAMAKLLKGAE